MRIVSLNLHNIRSYTNASVEFPEGIVMLSGDIGSGKSTILLGIEFALFGLLRGELSGAALLRNGTQNGHVELTFTLNEKAYTIKRTLKRGAKSVEQGPGYLVADGARQDMTPIELRSAIITLLGYPSDLLTKSKNFVYRYTVYTPQEDMKRILQETSEDRLALLRRVFDIDKYARITTNAQGYAKALRERRRALDAVTSDIEEKRRQASEIESALTNTHAELDTITPRIELKRTELATRKNEMTLIEEERKQAEAIKREISVLTTQISLKTQQQTILARELAGLDEQLKNAPPLVPDTDALNARSIEITKLITEHERTLSELTRAIAEMSAERKQAENTTTKINSLAECPTCLQQVTPDHKEHIINTQQATITNVDERLNSHQELGKAAQTELTTLKTELEDVRKQQQDAAILRIKAQHHAQLITRRESLSTQGDQLKKDLKSANDRLAGLNERTGTHADIAERYTALKNATDALLAEERALSIKHSTLTEKKRNHAQMLDLIKEELERKEAARTQLERTQHLHHWITDYFIPLMDVMEKHVMATIHHEFNTLFTQWFAMLIEDTMTASLDETFTPSIQQNGYDVGVEHLSGGERTACALAYRLALNKTINALIHTITTKDLLILDEPTDGFSAEQLDQMREVLSQLRLSQIIIVSHEQKVEGFADHIIRVHKEGHESSVNA